MEMIMNSMSLWFLNLAYYLLEIQLRYVNDPFYRSKHSLIQF